MTITRRLLLTLSITLFGLLLVGGYGLWQLNQAQSRLQYVEANTFPSLPAMTDAEYDLSRMRLYSLSALFSATQAFRNAAATVIA
jgi:methyl-accepting chemotaxis protein